jgi:hypothetical protein
MFFVDFLSIFKTENMNEILFLHEIRHFPTGLAVSSCAFSRFPLENCKCPTTTHKSRLHIAIIGHFNWRKKKKK